MRITRRTVLKVIPAFFATALFPDRKTLLAKPEKRELLLNKFFIAGFQFYDGPDLAGRFHTGMPLALRAEPDNAYDPFAVEILHDRTKLGYVPRTDNKHISRLLEQGAGLTCRVAEVDPEERAWRMVRVEVFLA
jgi:hypothetical protein